jgi:two-component system sensor histidine kinase KdpD
VGPEALGVIALVPRSGVGLGSDQRSFFEAFCRQAAFAFERARLSDQARSSALRAKTEELRSSLLSAVSHDLRTPLAVITGSATSVRDDTGLPPETRRELLETICEEAERLERLVANLLDMTRLETGGLSPRREWVPVEELIGAALTRLESKLKQRPVTTLMEANLPMLSVDPVLFQQVFLNLLENAVKYTTEDSPIEITAKKLDGNLCIDVADRGNGIQPGDEERIFEKFFRGTHVGVGGVGLGLPICRGIVEAHGGTLTAENGPERGAVFHIRIPIVSEAPRPELGAET